MSGDSRSFIEKAKDEIIPSLFAGGLGVLGASFILGVDLSTQLSVMGMSVPAWGAIGGIIAVSDIIAYAGHDFVLEKIPSLQGFATYENMFLAPVLSGVGCYTLFRTSISSDVSIVNSMLLGAGSSITGKYAFDMYNGK